MHLQKNFGLSTFPVFRRPKLNRKKTSVSKSETYAKPKPKPPNFRKRKRPKFFIFPKINRTSKILSERTTLLNSPHKNKQKNVKFLKSVFLIFQLLLLILSLWWKWRKKSFSCNFLTKKNWEKSNVLRKVTFEKKKRWRKNLSRCFFDADQRCKVGSWPGWVYIHWPISVWIHFFTPYINIYLLDTF